MSEADVPNSFRDPFWANLASSTGQKLGLPEGLLSSILTNGERSNANQVSEAGARTPFQITPSTRKAALDKFGVDAYLNPENSAQVAGLLLKDSLTRNGGDPGAAIGEYIGGTNRANWGPQTQAYIKRVLGGIQEAGAGVGVVPARQEGPSTFDKAMQQMQLEQAPSKLAGIYQAYKSGQMSPQDASDYEKAVQRGDIMLGEGQALNASATPGTGGSTQAAAQAGTPTVPDGVMRAFARGDMTPQDMTDFEHAVRNGNLQLPQGMDANVLFGEPTKPKSIAERIASIPGSILESLTGSDRRTPTSDALPDWAGMPELNQLSMASAKTGLGTLLSSPAETAQIIKANFPGAEISQDEGGNYLIRSSVDGKQYAIKPGFQVSDIPRMLGALQAFAPAGRASTIVGAGLKAAGAQAAIEGTQAATGGEFNPSEVAGAGLLGAATPVVSRVIGMASQPVKTFVASALGREAPALEKAAGAAEMAQPSATSPTGTPSAAPGPAAATQTPLAAPAGDSVQEIAATARQAAQGGLGSKTATQQLAEIARPNPETAASAERLGISDYLQPDHITSNDAYRQTIGILKSMSPVSALSQTEKQGLENVAKRASGLIDEIGGTNDLSTLSDSVKGRMQATHAELSAREDSLWNKLREEIPKKTETPANTTLEFLNQRADELGGAQNLSPMEKVIASKLAPRSGGDAAMLEALGPAARQQAIEQGAGAARQPTYALVDQVRRDVGSALGNAIKRSGPFSDADQGLASKYYGLLTGDQEAVANALGKGDLVQAAKAATVVRKGMESDLQSLFGKELDKSLTPQLGSSMKAAASGDTSGLLGILRATPESMRPQVVASGLASVFRNAATRGEIDFTGFSKWYQNLQRNRQAFSAVMSNLPAQARIQIADLAAVSKGISDSLAARIATGRLGTVVNEAIQAPDSLASRLFDLAKHAGKGLVADAAGAHGAGMAMGLFSALKGGAKSSALKAIDELLTSPEFVQLARASGTAKEAPAVRSMAYSKAFNRFARAIGNPREISDRERWIASSIQAENNLGGR